MTQGQTYQALSHVELLPHLLWTVTLLAVKVVENPSPSTSKQQQMLLSSSIPS